MEINKIVIISYGQFEIDFLEEVCRDIKTEFNYDVEMQKGHIDLTNYYDPVRRQYNANEILKEIDSISHTRSEKRIGLFKVDLFIPILTYIFGQASLRGNTGIASMFRLRNEYYGIAKDDLILIERFSKVVIHELGHTFGLIHCHNPRCVMRSSTYVEDIDQKEQQFCHQCRKIFLSAGLLK